MRGAGGRRARGVHLADADIACGRLAIADLPTGYYLRRRHAPIQEIRAHQHCGDHQLHPRIDPACLAAGVVKAHQPVDICLGDGPAEGVFGKIRGDPLGAGALLVRFLGFADEELALGRCAVVVGRVGRPHDLDTANDAQQSLVPQVKECGVLSTAADRVVGVDPRALDKGHHHFMWTARHLHRYVLESRLERLTRRRAAPVHERQVLRAADLLPEDLLAIDQDDQRLLVLKSPRVEPDVEVQDVDPVLPVRRKRVLEPLAAPGAGRHAGDVAVLVAELRRREIGDADLRHSVADRQASGVPRGAHVLLQEGGRHRQGRGDVAEPLHFHLGGQVLGRVDFHGQQILHRIGELGAAHAFEGDVAREPRADTLVDGALEPADEPVDLCLAGLETSGRRHQPTAQLVHRRLEDLGLPHHGSGLELVEPDARGIVGGVMAVDAVAVD